MKHPFFIFAFFLLPFASCKREPLPTPDAAYKTGVFTINEGIFNQTSGTVSFFQPDSLREEQDIFKTINGRDLGNVVQSMYLYGNHAYIVVNNSHKIEIATADDFKEKAQITGLAQPRYFLPVSDSLAYISQWGMDGLTGGVVLVNTNTAQVLQTIPTDAGAEQMALYQNQLYIACSGGYNVGNTVQVLNITSKSITTTIPVFDSPNSMKMGSDGNLWLLCAGKTVYSNYPDVDTAASTAPALLAIRPNDGVVVQTVLLEKGYPATQLTANSDGSRLYFHYNHKIWDFRPATLQKIAFADGNFYGLGCQPSTGMVYAARSAGIERAWVLRYTDSGTVVDSFQAGVFANGFVFR